MAVPIISKHRDGAEYIQPCKIRDKYGIGRTTVWRLTKKMATIPKYENSFIRISDRLTLINASDFDEFIKSQDLAYLKG